MVIRVCMGYYRMVNLCYVYQTNGALRFITHPFKIQIECPNIIISNKYSLPIAIILVHMVGVDYIAMNPVKAVHAGVG